MGTGSRRNTPCHCGSGKKYKNCCLKKDARPRVHGGVFSVDEDVLWTGMTIEPNGRVRMMSGDKPVDVINPTTAEWRKDAAGDLRRVSEITSRSEMFVDPVAAISKADFVFGVDTNQITLHGDHYYITCLTCATRQVAPAEYAGSIQQIQAIDFCDGDHVAEKIGWLFAIECILRSGITTDQQVILCTDHDMNAHLAINRQQQPVLDDYLLPTNFCIMYARDKGSSVLNKVVAGAHKGATAVGRALQAGEKLPKQFVLPYLLGLSNVPPRMWHSDAYSRYFEV